MTSGTYILASLASIVNISCVIIICSYGINFCNTKHYMNIALGSNMFSEQKYKVYWWTYYTRAIALLWLMPSIKHISTLLPLVNYSLTFKQKVMMLIFSSKIGKKNNFKFSIQLLCRGCRQLKADVWTPCLIVSMCYSLMLTNTCSFVLM